MLGPSNASPALCPIDEYTYDGSIRNIEGMGLHSIVPAPYLSVCPVLPAPAGGGGNDTRTLALLNILFGPVLYIVRILKKGSLVGVFACPVSIPRNMTEAN